MPRPTTEQLDKAIESFLDSMEMDTLICYARDQLQAWAKTADDEEIDNLIEQHGE